MPRSMIYRQSFDVTHPHSCCETYLFLLVFWRRASFFSQKKEEKRRRRLIRGQDLGSKRVQSKMRIQSEEKTIPVVLSCWTQMLCSEYFLLSSSLLIGSMISIIVQFHYLHVSKCMSYLSFELSSSKTQPLILDKDIDKSHKI